MDKAQKFFAHFGKNPISGSFSVVKRQVGCRKNTLRAFEERMMKMSKLAMALLAAVVTLAGTGSADAGFPKLPKVRVPQKFNSPKIQSPGKFQQKVVAGASVGAANGAAFGSFAGPVGSAAGAAGGAVSGSAGVIIGNHAEKKWTGKGLQNWNKPSRW